MGPDPARGGAYTLSASIERFTAHYHERNPVNATFTGVHAHDHRLPDWTRAGREREIAEQEALVRDSLLAHPTPMSRWATLARGRRSEPHVPRYKGPDWRALAADPLALDAALAGSVLAVRTTELDSCHFHDRNPALWTGEAIFGAVSLMIRPFAPREARLGALEARLTAIPGFLSAMRTGMIGRVPPRWIDRARRECAAAARLFDRGLTQWLEEEPVEPRAADRVRAAGQEAAKAFARCAVELGTLRVASDHEYGIGGVALDALISDGHWCTESFDVLLRRALGELDVARARLDADIREVIGTPDAFQAALAADHPDGASYLRAFADRWDACRAHAADHDAVQWPEWPIRYTPIPGWAREAAPHLYWLFYRSPAPFDPYTTHEYLVTPIDDTVAPEERERRLRACNHSTITLNHVVHHGAVGHHVQNWHATHRSRSQIGTIAGVDCASRIGLFLGGTMTEGWACYATDLMDELGFLSPLERVAEQQSRVRMLARAVVDIRLHSHLFSYSEAVAFYRDTVGMSDDAANGEATKNSMFPATALMYWLGTQGILSLRETMRARRGAPFSLRAFHDDLLGWGSIPVPLVTRLLTEGDQ